MLKTISVLALVVSLGACAVNSTGQETVFGIATPFSGVQVAVIQADVQAAVAALPSLCQTFANGAALIHGEITVLQSAQVKLSPATVAAISKLSTNGQVGCNGTVAVLAGANGVVTPSTVVTVPAASIPTSAITVPAS